ncbi:MAG: hypothetical protein JSR97_10295 [Verrucomicrobia bacterium]|nr:hypothetical protein [Verrucomicrobiota bacterium]
MVQKVTVFSIKKLIPRLKEEINGHELLPFPNIIDHITPPDMRWENKTHRQYKKQRLH